MPPFAITSDMLGLGYTAVEDKYGEVKGFIKTLGGATHDKDFYDDVKRHIECITNEIGEPEEYWNYHMDDVYPKGSFCATTWQQILTKNTWFKCKECGELQLGKIIENETDVCCFCDMKKNDWHGYSVIHLPNPYLDIQKICPWNDKYYDMYLARWKLNYLCSDEAGGDIADYCNQTTGLHNAFLRDKRKMIKELLSIVDNPHTLLGRLCIRMEALEVCPHLDPNDFPHCGPTL